MTISAKKGDFILQKCPHFRLLSAHTVTFQADWSEQLAGENYDVVFATVADKDAAERALKVLGPEGSFIYTLQQAGLKDKENPEARICMWSPAWRKNEFCVGALN